MTKRIKLAIASMFFMGLLSVPGVMQAAVKVGDKAPHFALTDVRTGREAALDQLTGPRGAVLIFVATECPYSNAFNKVMSDLAREYESKGLKLVGINSNKTEPLNAVKQHAEKEGLEFMVLKDEGNRIADQFGATRTPEVYVLDQNNVVNYHGAIGNSKMPTTKPEAATADDLRPALDAVVNGTRPPVPETKAFGCTIKR